MLRLLCFACFCLFSTKADLDPGMKMSILQHNYTSMLTRSISWDVYWTLKSNNVVDYCIAFTEHYLPEHIWRCYSAVTFGIRTLKIRYINALITNICNSEHYKANEIITREKQDMFNRVTDDSAIYSISYPYDSDYSKTTNNRTVCIFGSFSIKVTLFTLFSFDGIDLWLFIPSPLSRTDEILLNTAKSIALQHGRTVTSVISDGDDTQYTAWRDQFTSSSCGTVHVRGEGLHLPTILKLFVAPAAKADVIWERHLTDEVIKTQFLDRPRFYDPLGDPRIAWQCSLKWPDR